MTQSVQSSQDVVFNAPDEALKHIWGFDRFRPLQREAIDSILADRDSLVVLPTGGGKSLCFQVPALCRPGLAIVVSPLISLMKDQVDSLNDNGVPAAFINSSLSFDERRAVADRVRNRELKLLYLAPERLVTEQTIAFLKQIDLSFIAIDEAHCISQWGHNFRPEYRSLSILRDRFPDTGVHAYTATATERVRDDIASQLKLRDPRIFVGSFDRPNLILRVQRRSDALGQIREILEGHKGESGIVYCISRADVDGTSHALNQAGFRTRPYHAGMEDEERKANQEAFIAEEVDTIVATVAFGMGIDKSNVRYVVHHGMPKSLEHYQQEAGRAGRDGLDAECSLLYSPGDFGTWKRILEFSEETVSEAALTQLNKMASYCSGMICRHRMLVNHFGQTYEAENCGACDVCLDEVERVEDALVVAQKILSSVVRQGQRYGGEYTSLVLKGSRDQRILRAGHDSLSTWGLLSDHSQSDIRDWIEQLVAQSYLEKNGEYNVLEVTESGRQLLKGQANPRLSRPAPKAAKSSRRTRTSVADDSWEGVDHDLFEELRQLRREKATERGVPPYIVFNDATLRAMARDQPTTLSGLREIRGVGDAKLKEYGDDFLACIRQWTGDLTSDAE